jgi:protein TonB
VIEQPAPKQEPWISVEQPPEFPGGEPALFKFLADNLKYPPEAKELGVTGRVFVYFVVEPDGSVSSVSVKRGIGSGCDEEAVRVVQSLPRWSPGKQGGIAVRVQFTLPVKFVLH